MRRYRNGAAALLFALPAVALAAAIGANILPVAAQDLPVPSATGFEDGGFICDVALDDPVLRLSFHFKLGRSTCS